MTSSESTQDKAGKDYWDSVWENTELPVPINPRIAGHNNYFNARFHQLLCRHLPKGPQRSLIEIGCARSAWLPYFAREFQYEVTGLDYSEIGCEQERQVLANAGVPGAVVCADMFNPPTELEGAFDVLISFGVVEHFDETRRCTDAFARLLRPGGIMVTLIPNMVGSVGWLSKLINPAVYAKHVPLDRKDLGKAHTDAGLTILFNEYFMSNNYGVVNLNGLDPSAGITRIRRIGLRAANRLSTVIIEAESRTRPLRATRTFAPYIICIARKDG